MRRSGRPRCPPVEFWNFERPDYSLSHEISYNISVLGNISRKHGNSTLQGNTKEFSIVLNDIHKTKAGQKGNYDSELKTTSGRKRSKQVETVTNAGNQRKSIPREEREASRRTGPLLPKNAKTEKNEILRNDSKTQPTKGKTGNKEIKNRDPIGEKGQNITKASQVHVGESGSQEKRVPSNVGSKTQNRTNRVCEASDSGVTDLDISCGNTVISEARTTEKDAEISNIHSVYQDSQDLTEGTDDILSNLSRNNSYCRNRKPLNFTGVLSSTAVNEVDISKFNSSKTSSAGSGTRFKVPRSFPKVLLKKHSRIEPTLDSIAEEKENDACDPESDSTTYITPKKSSKLVRSRLLNLEDLEDENNKESETQPSGKQDKENRDEGKHFAGLSLHDPMLTNVTSQNLTTQSDFGSSRRSSRARIKRLEFWNFEKAHVTTMNNGEVSVAYTKLEDPSESVTISKKRKDNSKSDPVTLLSDRKHNRKQAKHLPKDTLISKEGKKSKRLGGRLVEPGNRKKSTLVYKRKTASFDEGQSLITPDASPRKRMKRHSLLLDEFLPTTERVDFESIMFTKWDRNDFLCFLAGGYSNKKEDLYSGFLFLQRGEMFWSTTKLTTFCVIEGEGNLSVLNSEDDDDGILITLTEKAKTIVPAGRKVKLEKEDSDKLLKLLIVLQNKPS